MLPFMKLDVYLENKHLSHVEFGALVGVTAKAVQHWCVGDRRPRLELLRKIEAATAGKVTALDFYGPSPEKAEAAE